jgi:hypothetical protein
MFVVVTPFELNLFVVAVQFSFYFYISKPSAIGEEMEGRRKMEIGLC